MFWKIWPHNIQDQLPCKKGPFLGLRYVNVRMLPTFHMERFLEYVYVNKHPESFLRLEHKHGDLKPEILLAQLLFSGSCRFLWVDVEYRPMLKLQQPNDRVMYLSFVSKQDN